MTRIIAGWAGSLSLSVPASGTRPTSDRVREAVFSILQSRIAFHRLRVLDLYCGSGVLALEAISRGAGRAVLVDSSSRAAQVCRENARLVLRNAPDAEISIEVRAKKARAFLEASTETWDLVFIDPPYSLTEAELSADLELLKPFLAEDAVVVVERSSNSPEPAWPAGLTTVLSRKYGDTAVWFASQSQPDQSR
ncbi:MAG: 16S rRNA (guanine(966)-N(2))-methyltransferase RsmD [Cryobacterium sp.]|nr:16S rRNA (guanine(966)-N(2))-methyltransferase RsmD [Cryobacterium sp.]MBX3089254.1 16S rRNA (guanine(966)-N(2))-methyltransferase RsmD [Cryobacterium sp.]MCO5294526.1 16S rRNA (guanine(966)-N(2))-methyltransferase RsmD [Homoserinimonas sp.]